MDELLDQTIPETSQYLGGRLRGYSLRTLFRRERLIDNLLRDPRFKEQHATLWAAMSKLRDDRDQRDIASLYEGMGLRAPASKRGR